MYLISIITPRIASRLLTLTHEKFIHTHLNSLQVENPLGGTATTPIFSLCHFFCIRFSFSHFFHSFTSYSFHIMITFPSTNNNSDSHINHQHFTSTWFFFSLYSFSIHTSIKDIKTELRFLFYIPSSSSNSSKCVYKFVLLNDDDYIERKKEEYTTFIFPQFLFCTIQWEFFFSFSFSIIIEHRYSIYELLRRQRLKKRKKKNRFVLLSIESNGENEGYT